ncbi:glycerophosphoryl diester phosphodiesterase family domain-containing protein [Ditylenchus destructor]|uniref:Glycerophosphoryl diester phosphodiesterase family domain-containing protein n=1 Tax=Ditylenchus destructor TaxID=166010 RepID=A0AAD4N447_9BILA|nr:glycerophosphoryl diester phosphodiesterase family domain-containing protein [Ditylenchus destructor]
MPLNKLALTSHTAVSDKDKAVRITKAAVGGSKVTVHFHVNCPLVRPWEFVLVCGSHDKLGSWVPERAPEMVKDPQMENRWSTSIQLTAHECRNLLQFRYFIGYYLQSQADAKKTLIVSSWESHRIPRCILPSVEAIRGSCRDTHVDEYGFHGGRRRVNDGWLNTPDQSQIFFRIHGEALTFFKQRHSQRSYHIRVTPFDLRHKEVGSDDAEPDENNDGSPPLPSFSLTELANLSGTDPSFHEQSSTGELYRNSTDYLIARTRSLAFEYLAFRIELFTHMDHLRVSPIPPSSCNGTSSQSEAEDDAKNLAEKPLERFAIAYCMPSSIQESTSGEISIPLLAKNQQPVGQIKMEYLFITALSKPHPKQHMGVSFINHWKKRRTLEVGHRGCGSSYTKLAAVRENTIHSLNQAARRGADFVEFDVQLSRDKSAVIFHDFHVLVSVAKKSPSIVDFHQLAVKDLRLDQLRLLQVHHHKALDNLDMSTSHQSCITGGPDEAFEMQPFPRLIDALQQINPDTGFNIEIKYPMVMKNGEHECKNFFERNEYVDIIVADVLNYGGERRIVFSSFDPDICLSLSVKQNKYPVLFLVVGETSRYVPFQDARTQNSLTAVNFAMCSQILGANFHSEDLLRDPSPVARAKEFGLISFVWGDDLEKQENIDYFRKKILVDGIIYDRIGEIEHRRNVFVVERELRKAMYVSLNYECNLMCSQEQKLYIATLLFIYSFLNIYVKLSN